MRDVVKLLPLLVWKQREIGKGAMEFKILNTVLTPHRAVALNRTA
jgi:hypothetical protein